MTPSELASVHGWLFDVDGVLRVGSRAIPGSAELLDELVTREIPFRLLTNSTTASRATLATRLRDMGLPVTQDWLITATMATAAYVRRRFPDVPCFLLAKGDAVDDFRDAGIPIVGPDGAPDAGVVVIGPFVAALAAAAGVRAIVIGKPAAAFFRQAIRDIGLPASALAMVGDDARTDLAPARRLGMTGVLVRTGKPVGRAEEERADLVIDSIADLAPLIRLAAKTRDTLRT